MRVMLKAAFCCLSSTILSVTGASSLGFREYLGQDSCLASPPTGCHIFWFVGHTIKLFTRQKLRSL